MQEDLLNEHESHQLQWRCRRGLLENDLLIDRFFKKYGAQVTRGQADAINALMDLPDNDLLDLLLRRTELSDQLDTPQTRQVLQLMRTPL